MIGLEIICVRYPLSQSHDVNTQLCGALTSFVDVLSDAAFDHLIVPECIIRSLIMLLHRLRPAGTVLSLSLPAFFSTMASTSSPSSNQSISPRPYVPRHDSFPYRTADFRRADETADTDFYSSPRFVTHIDDNAIGLLRAYYAKNLPPSGRILDLCSSWISHFPKELEEKAFSAKKQAASPGSETHMSDDAGLEVIGQGMNAAELAANPILHSTILQDLNTDPNLPNKVAPLDASTCVVSIDYLTQPVRVLSSILEHTRPGGTVHLTVSNRCFPTKVVGRWLRVDEEERLQMVGDYLWFAGWRDIQICTLNDGKSEIGAASGIMDWFSGRTDPVWVVRGTKTNV